ncbi:MAG: hypothetical protein IT563_10435 [Alphaproteobacteria bacterium]|nr:hypothetical protein [Alphaproteobacteria bacterium]
MQRDFLGEIADWPLDKKCRTVARFWSQQWGAIQLTILREKGEGALADFKFKILNRHQRTHFLSGVDRLGISRDLPPAVIAGRYHYLSNMIGGLAMEYIEETPKKVWVRYLPPAWSFPGLSICAVPSSAPRRMFAGWHPYNGPSLGTNRLAFVVTKTFQDGEPYDEGYFEEFDRDLAPDERLQFRVVTRSPDFDPAAAPKLDPKQWPADRLSKAFRNFSRGYLRDGVLTSLELFGLHAAAGIIGQAVRLCALQHVLDFASAFGIQGRSAADLARCFALLCYLGEEQPSLASDRPGRYILRRRPKAFERDEIADEIWQALFAYPLMAAKIFSARIRVTRSAPDRLAGDEEWIFEDTPDRLF